MRTRNLSVVLGLVTAMLLQTVAGPAAAAAGPGSFGCQVATLRLSGPGGVEEIGVVNPTNTPCVDEEFSTADLRANVFLGSALPTTLELRGSHALAATAVEPRHSSASLVVSDLDLEYTNWNNLANPTTVITLDALLFSVAADCVDNPEGKPTAQHPCGCRFSRSGVLPMWVDRH